MFCYLLNLSLQLSDVLLAGYLVILLSTQMSRGGVVKIPWAALIQDLKIRKKSFGFRHIGWLQTVDSEGKMLYFNTGCRRWGIDGYFIQSSI